MGRRVPWPSFKALLTCLVDFAAWLSLLHQRSGADLPAGRFVAVDTEPALTAGLVRNKGRTWQGATHLRTAEKELGGLGEHKPVNRQNRNRTPTRRSRAAPLMLLLAQAREEKQRKSPIIA